MRAVGEIIAVDMYIGHDAVLIGYDKKEGVLAIIASNERETMLASVLKCHSLCNMVERGKLLHDLGLPDETRLIPAVLGGRFKAEENPFLSRLIKKLGVTIAQQ